VNKIIASGSDNILARTGDLHLPINARFALNPQQKLEYMDFSALDWVENGSRKLCSFIVDTITASLASGLKQEIN
jgi:hypothetical protein